MRLLRPIAALAKVIYAALFGFTVGVVGLAILMTILMILAETRSPFPVKDVSQRKPYADFIGREYRLVNDMEAVVWNDFPDKKTLLTVTLMRPPGIANRFVSDVIDIQRGQRLRIVSASRQFARSNGILDPADYQAISN
jgi:hypothetical protein